MLNSEKPRQEKACKLLTSIVNSMTTKMEIGAPMASAYLLEQPDHYTSHRFKPFYWMPFVRQAQTFSVVSDYTLRPEFYDDITVYDWMCQAHKKRANIDQEDTDDIIDEDEITLNDMKFLDGHPQRDSHRIKFSPDSQGLVPNFLGGTIPRRDKGDHEYYCATMLTLFKPWRTGFDLKNDFESWEDAFTSYTFTGRQLQIMSFMQIRFECNDA
ncbi:hypothetical protein K439DRAFT_1648184 [Ramaria rubella]|nr:hypothetical protein K439DRAFT_1648184 [Ramaria rubella]